MELTIQDRLAIYFTILQNIGNIQTILLNRKIRKKIEITQEESEKGVILDKDDKGGVFIKFISEDAKNIIIKYDFNDEEIKYLKECCEILDKNNKVTEFLLDTILKIISVK